MIGDIFEAVAACIIVAIVFVFLASPLILLGYIAYLIAR